MSTKGKNSTPVVMDVLPWPNGYGFTGGDNWWQHTLSQTEKDRLDNLLGLALLDHSVCDQLVIQRDPSLLAAFGLSDDTRRWLTNIQANSLKELAQAVLAAWTGYRGVPESEAA